MRRIRDVLRYHYGEGNSQRLTARYAQLSAKTVRNYLACAKEAGLTWPLLDGLTDEELEVLLFPEPASIVRRPQPDWEDVENQLARKHMTLSGSGMPTTRPIRTGIATDISANSTRIGKAHGTWSCGSTTRWATSSLWTLPARMWRSCLRRSHPGADLRSHAGAPITPMWKRCPIRRYAVGSVLICGPWPSSAQYLRSSSATT